MRGTPVGTKLESRRGHQSIWNALPLHRHLSPLADPYLWSPGYLEDHLRRKLSQCMDEGSAGEFHKQLLHVWAADAATAAATVDFCRKEINSYKKPAQPPSSAASSSSSSALLAGGGAAADVVVVVSVVASDVDWTEAVFFDPADVVHNCAAGRGKS